MTSQRDASYLVLVTVGSAVVFCLSTFLNFIVVCVVGGSAIRHANFWWIWPLMGTLGRVLIN
jgi:hypothetical protein